MNLNKLFNFKYLKQNLKKSKGQLILFLSIVPIFTFLILSMNYNDAYTSRVEIFELALINILGMYVIPIILSINLFGYVYKRKSIDFINSMPINKVTIFLTNTFGGILIITLMQLVNMLGLFIIKNMYPSAIIFTGMIFDVFIVMTISYIFMFVATNIAMSISGNKLTQIVVTMLILFLVPFTACTINDGFYEDRHETMFLLENETVGNVQIIDEVNETTPYRMIRMIFGADSNEQLFNGKSLTKMTFLSVAYIIIGCYLFKNRKFENAEESFQNVYMHLFIKALTMFPMVVILFEINYLKSDIEYILFALALISAYYFIYDIVTGKKVKFIPSVISLVITIIILNLICMGIFKIREQEFNKINKEDIVGISINVGRKREGGYSSSEVMNYYMNNEELIEFIYETNEEYEDRYIARYRECPVNLKMKNGKVYRTFLYIKTNKEYREEHMRSLINILSKDEGYVKVYKEQFKNNGKIMLEGYIANEEENEFFNKKFNEYIDKTSIYEIYNNVNDSVDLIKYEYINHRKVTTYINARIDSELFEYVIQTSNNLSKERLQRKIENKERFELYVNFENAIDMGSKDFYQEEELEIVKNVILKNEKEEIDVNRNYYVIRSYTSKDPIIYYTLNPEIAALYGTRKTEGDWIYDEKTGELVQVVTSTVEEVTNTVNEQTNVVVNVNQNMINNSVTNEVTNNVVVNSL